MRILVPERIAKLPKIFAPYMHMDKQKQMLVLSEDAPDEVKKAKMQFDDFWRNIHERFPEER